MKTKSIKVEDNNSEHWESFYSGYINLEESTFCTKIKETFQDKYMIVDIGCGSGRDSFSFAKSGIEVIGVDRSQEAISKNLGITLERNLSKFASFERIDLSDEKELNRLLNTILIKSKNSGNTIILYLRFLLHAVDEATQDLLLDVIASKLPSGSFFVAEFRTIEDENIVKTYDDHYRRFICAETFRDTMIERGFLINEFYKGVGLSKYKEEDPYLARVIAEKR
jgi:SAM-dependent methyltransferase